MPSRLGLQSCHTIPINGTPSSPMEIVHSLPFAIIPSSLVVNPGTGCTMTVVASANGTAMTGASVTATSGVANSSAISAGTLAAGTTITLTFSSITGTPAGSVQLNWEYASP